MFVNINPNFRNKINELIHEMNDRENSNDNILKEKFVQYLEKYDVELSRKKQIGFMKLFIIKKESLILKVQRNFIWEMEKY